MIHSIHVHILLLINTKSKHNVYRNTPPFDKGKGPNGILERGPTNLLLTRSQANAMATAMATATAEPSMPASTNNAPTETTSSDAVQSRDPIFFPPNDGEVNHDDERNLQTFAEACRFAADCHRPLHLLEDVKNLPETIVLRKRQFLTIRGIMPLPVPSSQGPLSSSPSPSSSSPSSQSPPCRKKNSDIREYTQSVSTQQPQSTEASRLGIGSRGRHRRRRQRLPQGGRRRQSSIQIKRTNRRLFRHQPRRILLLGGPKGKHRFGSFVPGGTLAIGPGVFRSGNIEGSVFDHCKRGCSRGLRPWGMPRPVDRLLRCGIGRPGTLRLRECLRVLGRLYHTRNRAPGHGGYRSIVRGADKECGNRSKK
mmetsp:Transcript_14278/g.30244  ORF Transcript_14278/g.30244 Transcript_14278/m.30244 type:complete len:366 (-) Transcript_14278:48-1145(-)